MTGQGRRPRGGAPIAASAAVSPLVLVAHDDPDVRGSSARSSFADGTAGDQIPQGAALLALADAVDAMTTARPYGAIRTWAEAVEVCRSERGAQFCPDAVDALEIVDGEGQALGL